MITDKDVKKLKEVFATKDDLKFFATKDDLKSFATKDDIQEINIKFDKLDHRIENSVGSLAKDIMTVIEMVGDTNQKLDKINNKITEHDDILENHERRLDKVEDKIFTTGNL